MEEDHRFTNEIIGEAVADQLNISKSEVGKRIKVKSFSVSEGSKKGDNFACVMKAISAEVDVDGKTETFHFMGKCIPMNPMREKWIKEGKIFEKEVLAYTVIMPALKKLQKGEIDLAIPDCHYASEKDMLMQNLKMIGYQLVDKRVGLDKPAIKLLLDQLSMLHSLSYHWIKTYPGGEKSLREAHPLFFHDNGWISHGNEENKLQFEGMMTKMFEGSAGIVENFAKDRPELGQKMRNFTKVIVKALDDVSRPKPDQFCAMLHGDCWNNNFMFLYDDAGNLKNMKMVDLQLMRYGCICHDLVYFLCTSTSPDMRKEHLGEFLQHYHSRLMKHLSNFNYPASIYPFESFKKDFDDCFLFGYICGAFIAQIILSEKASEAGGTMDMDDVKTDEEMLKKMENMDKQLMKEAEDNVPLQKRIIQLTEEAIERGLI